MARTCKSCASRCYLITLKCLYEGDTLLNGGLPQAKLLAAMDSAQVDWVKPLIGADCFAELCAAITAYEVDATPIPAKWETLLEEVTPLVRSATEYQYMLRSRAVVGSDGQVQVGGNIKADDWAGFISGLKADLAVKSRNFKKWLADNSPDYPCLLPEKCEIEPESGGGSGWDVVGGNPRVGNNPSFQTF